MDFRKKYELLDKQKLEEQRKKDQEEELQYPPRLQGKHRLAIRTANLLNMIEDLENILLDIYDDDLSTEHLKDLLFVDFTVASDHNKIDFVVVNCQNYVSFN